MSADLMPFVYGDATVRTIVIDSEPWFVLADLCAVLGIANPRNVAARLDEADVRQADIRSGGQMRSVTVVNESGMYEVVIRSDKPGAVAFRRWLTGEVLPAIRKTGAYSVANQIPADYPSALEEAARQARLVVEERKARELAEAQVEADRPLVERAKAHAGAEGLKTRQQFFREVKQWAQSQHGVTVKQAQVVEFLSTRKLGLFIRGNRSDSGQATAWAIEHGYAENVEDTALNGHNYVTGKLTARGQAYAWERVFRYIDANGTLELPRQIGGAA